MKFRNLRFILLFVFAVLFGDQSCSMLQEPLESLVHTRNDNFLTLRSTFTGFVSNQQNNRVYEVTERPVCFVVPKIKLPEQHKTKLFQDLREKARGCLSQHIVYLESSEEATGDNIRRLKHDLAHRFDESRFEKLTKYAIVKNCKIIFKKTREEERKIFYLHKRKHKKQNPTSEEDRDYCPACHHQNHQDYNHEYEVAVQGYDFKFRTYDETQRREFVIGRNGSWEEVKTHFGISGDETCDAFINNTDVKVLDFYFELAFCGYFFFPNEDTGGSFVRGFYELGFKRTNRGFFEVSHRHFKMDKRCGLPSFQDLFKQCFFVESGTTKKVEPEDYNTFFTNPVIELIAKEGFQKRRKKEKERRKEELIKEQEKREKLKFLQKELKAIGNSKRDLSRKSQNYSPGDNFLNQGDRHLGETLDSSEKFFKKLHEGEELQEKIRELEENLLRTKEKYREILKEHKEKESEIKRLLENTKKEIKRSVNLSVDGLRQQKRRIKQNMAQKMQTEEEQRLFGMLIEKLIVKKTYNLKNPKRKIVNGFSINHLLLKPVFDILHKKCSEGKMLFVLQKISELKKIDEDSDIEKKRFEEFKKRVPLFMRFKYAFSEKVQELQKEIQENKKIIQENKSKKRSGKKVRKKEKELSIEKIDEEVNSIFQVKYKNDFEKEAIEAIDGVKKGMMKNLLVMDSLCKDMEALSIPTFEPVCPLQMSFQSPEVMPMQVTSYDLLIFKDIINPVDSLIKKKKQEDKQKQKMKEKKQRQRDLRKKKKKQQRKKKRRRKN